MVELIQGSIPGRFPKIRLEKILLQFSVWDVNMFELKKKKE